MVAQQDQLLVEAADVVVAPGAVDGDPPLEHRPRDMQAPRDNAVELAGVL